MSNLAFILSMPSNNSWNNKWSGAERVYAVIQRIGSKKWRDKILSNAPYFYNFGDGWTACVDVKEVDAVESRKLRKASAGFCGYNWMIDSIRSRQEITI